MCSIHYRRNWGRDQPPPARPNTSGDDPVIAMLSAVLAGVPSLPGAKCRGRGHLFDAPAKGELTETTAARHQQALQLCRTCPALGSCTTWYERQALQALRQRPSGVIAGRVIP